MSSDNVDEYIFYDSPGLSNAQYSESQHSGSFSDSPSADYYESNTRDPEPSHDLAPAEATTNAEAADSHEARPSTSFSTDNSPPDDLQSAVEQQLPDTIPPKRKNDVRPEICAVCGDKSECYHYEAPACNGCKTFFRRTVQNQYTYKCVKNRECLKTFSRKYRLQCRACRFERCVSAGMNILGVSVVASKEMHSDAHSGKKGSANGRNKKNVRLASKLTVQPATVENYFHRVLEQLVLLEQQSDKLRQSSYNPSPYFLTLKDAMSGHSKFGYRYEMLQEVDYASASWPLPISSSEKYSFTSLPEDGCFTLKDPCCAEGRQIRHAKIWKIMDALCVIEYLKTLDFYSTLGDGDKSILVKGVTFPCSYFLLAYYSYSQNREAMIYPDGSFVPWSGRGASCCKWQGVPSHHAYLIARGLIRILSDVNIDRTEYILLKALIACNHMIPGLSSHAQQILAPEREKYAKCLFHHVMKNRGTRNGPAAYSQLLAIGDTMARFGDTAKGVHVYLSAIGRLKMPLPLVDDICSSN